MTYPDGVTCEVVILRLERYLTSALPLSEALDTAEHIEACFDCAGRLVLVRVRMTRRSGPGRRHG